MTPKDICEELLNSILPHAQALLVKNREFYPIGEVMDADNKVTATAVFNGDEHPDSNAVINDLIKSHRELAANSGIVASGIAWDATITTESGKQDAVIVSLEHKDGYSVVLVQPYRIGLFKKVQFGELLAQEGRHDVFC